eukprot:jgi/Ulvmu1/6135/UM027_0113.1
MHCSPMHQADRMSMETPSSPVWHRSGWSARFKHTGHARSTRLAPQARGEPANAKEGLRFSGPVVAHTYTSTTVHSKNCSHSVKAQIVMPTHAGPYGDTPLECNMAGFCGELDDRLLALNTTLQAVHQDAHEKLVRRHRSIQSCQAGSQAARQTMNSSIARQMELHTATVSNYCQAQR